MGVKERRPTPLRRIVAAKILEEGAWKAGVTSSAERAGARPVSLARAPEKVDTAPS